MTDPTPPAPVRSYEIEDHQFVPSKRGYSDFCEYPADRIVSFCGRPEAVHRPAPAPVQPGGEDVVRAALAITWRAEHDEVGRLRFSLSADERNQIIAALYTYRALSAELERLRTQLAEADAAMGERPAAWSLADAITADHAALDDAKEVEDSLRDECERLRKAGTRAEGLDETRIHRWLQEDRSRTVTVGGERVDGRSYFAELRDGEGGRMLEFAEHHESVSAAINAAIDRLLAAEDVERVASALRTHAPASPSATEFTVAPGVRRTRAPAATEMRPCGIPGHPHSWHLCAATETHEFVPGDITDNFGELLCFVCTWPKRAHHIHSR